MTGTVFRIDQKGAYIDVGGKSTAFCPNAELALASVDRVRDSGGGAVGGSRAAAGLWIL